MKRLELTIHGRVQGVAFRWHTRHQALALGLTGWVRNRPDGTVRLVAEGEPATLDLLRAWAERGPDHARVDRVDTHWSEAGPGFAGFEITG
ncbi:acylphosphatase [bacterium]|nr:acylphosphatase [bacterium]